MNDRFSEFWRQAKEIRLGPEESQRLFAGILAKSANLVRAGTEARHTGRMKQDQLFAQAKSIRLSGAENEQIEQNIVAYMRGHPAVAGAAEGSDKLLRRWKNYFLRPVPMFSGGVGLFGIFGLSLSVAAHSALPGDFLYPIKVHVNEGVEAAFRFSPDARAKFEADRLEVRLEEAAKLAASGRMDAAVSDDMYGRIQEQILLANDRAEDLEQSGDDDGAADVHSHIESALRASETVLGSLAEKNEFSRSDIQGLLRHVKNAEKDVVRLRVASEKKVLDQAQDHLKAAAEVSIGDLTDAVKDVRVRLDRRNVPDDAVGAARLKEQLLSAEDDLRHAGERLKDGRYKESIELSKSAHRDAREAKILLKASEDLRVRSSSSPDHNGSGRKKDNALRGPDIRLQDDDKESR